MKKFLKFLHEVSAVGVMGALAAQIVFVIVARGLSPVTHAAVRRGIEALSQWVLLPSLAVVLLTGILSMAAHPGFQDAGWAWVKAALGIPMLQGTLTAVQGSARDAAVLSAQVAAGQADPAVMADVLRHEWGGLWVIMALSVVNIALAVWRPRRGLDIR